ncbi:MAG TPA: hypothetical protein VGQ09_23630 [Chitinophagaceae bacterium]|jgi:hypothetical protein|nr:hypothetical protein [Chitinophagaceae bacterium]
MKYNFLWMIVSATALTILYACGKNKFETTPTIRIKDVNDTEITPGSSLKITVECTDKEGDLGGGQLTYIRVRTNTIAIPNPSVNDKADTAYYTVPDFPKTDKIDLDLTIPYDFMNEDPNRNDTMFFKITVRDIESNQSDTIATKTIVARQN